jgi:ribonuclease P protein component
LLRADSFEQVIRADNATDQYFKIFFVKNSKNNARLGIIVSKRSFPRSVDRNRVKRFIREAFRHHKIRYCKLDLVVKVTGNCHRNMGMLTDNLNKQFSLVESRCAKLLLR